MEISMKIAVTASEQSLDAKVDPRFGRAAYFVVFDTESGDWSAHPFKKARWGDGYYGSAHLTRELDVDGLEVEHPSYEDDDRRLALETMELRGTGKLTPAETPNAESHWT